MRKFLRGAISLLLAAALSIPMFSMAAFAEEVPTVELPVKVELTGSKPSTAEELVVVLTAKDAACPMPEGSVDGVYRLSVTGGGDKKLPVIAFPS
ncbi:MAG: hypothetical protein Q4F21_14405, partial [Lachnospiraceae bacterium]|nr:hypothetical protein [Lachnospiraceae bacterium]